MVGDEVCCDGSMTIEGCPKTYNFAADTCTYDQNEATLSSTNKECCLEGWAINDSTLKTACSISDAERKYDATDKICTIVLTDINPLMQFSKEIEVHKKDCCKIAEMSENPEQDPLN